MQHLRRPPSSWVALGVACAVLAASHAARAALPGDVSTSFPIDDANPQKSIPSQAERDKEPLEYGYFLQDLIARAEPAFEQQDWARAVKYYEVLGRAEPEVGITFSRLCVAYAKLERYDVAAANCARAVSLPGARVLDHLHFIDYTLAKAKLSAVDIGDIDASLTYLRQRLPELTPAVAEPDAGAPALADMTPEQVKAAYLEQHSAAAVARKKALAKAAPPLDLPLEVELRGCELAAHLAEQQRLNGCLARLKAIHADARIALPFEWAAALRSGDEQRASALLASAERLGFPADAKAAMLAEQRATFARHGWLARLQSGHSTLVVLTLLVAGAVTAFVWWLALGSRRRRAEPAAESAEPAP